MKPFQKICTGVYCSGIVASSVLGVRDQIREHKYRIDSNVGFSFRCLGGAMIGGYVGLWWPLTVIGKGISAIDVVSKNN
jgi:hypothetical protein